MFSVAIDKLDMHLLALWACYHLHNQNHRNGNSEFESNLGHRDFTKAADELTSYLVLLWMLESVRHPPLDQSDSIFQPAHLTDYSSIHYDTKSKLPPCLPFIGNFLCFQEVAWVSPDMLQPHEEHYCQYKAFGGFWTG